MRQPRQHQPGFTLLEIMLAVTILALVMTAVYGIWSTSLTAWKRGMAVTESLQRGRVVLETLDELAKSAVFSPGNSSLYEVIGDTDPALGSSVSFITASDCLLPPSEAATFGLRRVTLELERDAQGQPYLSLVSAPALEEKSLESEPFRRVLSADVVYFRVRYRDPRTGTWDDFWRQPDVLPSALEFTLAFPAGERGAPPVVITRAIELPAAKHVLEARGQPISEQSTTNVVTLQDVNLSDILTDTDTEVFTE